jgi:hypothetical protein
MTKDATHTSTATKAPEIDIIERLKRTRDSFEDSNLNKLKALSELAGILVLPDHTGMICHRESFAIIAGEALYKRLRGEPKP